MKLLKRPHKKMKRKITKKQLRKRNRIPKTRLSNLHPDEE
jgi:hypothetical protein